MKKILILLFLPFYLFASNVNDIKASIIEQIAKVLHPNEEKLIICILDDTYDFLKSSIHHMKIVDECTHADLVIAKQIEDVSPYCQQDKFIILTKYQEYKQSDIPIGALFWQKGRPNLIFSKKRLLEFSMKLPASFSRYIE
jgi:hypothetical protein